MNYLQDSHVCFLFLEVLHKNLDKDQKIDTLS